MQQPAIELLTPSAIEQIRQEIEGNDGAETAFIGERIEEKVRGFCFEFLVQQVRSQHS